MFYGIGLKIAIMLTKLKLKNAFLQLQIASTHRVNQRQEALDWVLCAAPVPDGNRGDQALLHVAVQNLLKYCPGILHILQTSRHRIASVSGGKVELHGEFFQLFSTEESYSEQVKFARFLKGKRQLFLLGADVLDEHHGVGRSRGSFMAMRIAAGCGVDTRVLGFSINSVPKDEFAERLKLTAERTRLFPRDPVSFKRLCEAGIPNVTRAGDLAYLLIPSEASAITIRGVKHFIDSNAGRLVGLNFTSKVLGSLDHESRLFEVLPGVLKRLAGDGFRFILIPHDDRGGTDFSKILFDKLYSDLGSNVIHLSPMPSASEIKAVVKELSHLFTCRLHLGIAGLSQEIPVTGFPYQ